MPAAYGKQFLFPAVNIYIYIIGIIFASTSIGKAAGDFRSFTSAVRPVLLWSIQTV